MSCCVRSGYLLSDEEIFTVMATSLLNQMVVRRRVVCCFPFRKMLAVDQWLDQEGYNTVVPGCYN